MRHSLLLLFICSLFYQCTSEQEEVIVVEPEVIVAPPNLIEDYKEEIATIIRETIENRIPDERYSILGEELYSSVLIPQFYANRSFENAWITNLDSLELVDEFILYIEELAYHGLQPQHYHQEKILALRDSISMNSEANSFNPYNIAQLDMFLSDAFFMISSHLYNGKVNAESLTAEWGIRRDKPEIALDEKLELLIQRQAPYAFMKLFYPNHQGYEMMIAEAKALQNKLQDDYKTKLTLPKDKHSIDIWEDSSYIQSVNQKLNFLGYSAQDSIDFSDSLMGLFHAVKALQKAHGLNADGKLGRNTLIALDQSIEDKINSLYVNMERLRWLPDSLNKRHILVNIADFTLDYVNNQDTMIQMRTVVGKDFRQTPVFNARMTYLVFSPTWTVPPGILRNDVIPAVAKDINYLANKNMRVLDASGNSVDPTTIDWKRVRAGGKFPYRVRQNPGAQNALGRVKFMFPNKHSVYLHDTPSRELFARDERIFSSGCIRIEKPFELAKLLLADDSVRWNDNAIKEAMESGKETTVVLKSPVNVYIYYLTAWSNGKEMSYRQDIYGRDKEILEALKERK